MAGNSRTLKLKILGDVDSLNKSLASSQTGMQKFGKVAAAAFKVAAAAAALYATKLAVDGVKAAIEDEAAQVKLATTLRNVTAATNAQIAAIEEQIYQTSLAVGVADDQLRPAYDRLVRSTGDLTKSQQLLDLALNISAGTGKSLDSVVNALGKAYEGSNISLMKLGTGLDTAALSTMSFDEITKSLSETFAGQAATQADTFAGRMERIKVAFSELQEEAGARFLPILEKIIGWIINDGLPAFDKFSAWFSENITPALQDFAEWWDEYITPAIQLFVKWVQERLIPAFKQMVGYIKEDAQPVFDRIRQTWEDYQPQIKAVLGLLGAIADWVITVGVPVLVVGFFQAIGILIDTANAALKSMLAFLELIGVGVYETAKTTTKELKNMESGFSEMSDVQNAKLAASKSGLLGYQKEVKNTAKVGVDSYKAIGDAASASADKQAKAAAKVQKANDRMEAAWLASKASAKAVANALTAQGQKLTDYIQKLYQARDAYQAEIQQSIFDQFGLDEAAEDAGIATGKSYIQALLDTLNKGKDFSKNIIKLAKAGLSLDVLKQIAGMGSMAGGALAAELIASPEQIAQLNKTQAEFNNFAQTAAEAISALEYAPVLKDANEAWADFEFGLDLAGVSKVVDGQLVPMTPEEAERYYQEAWAATSEAFKALHPQYEPSTGVSFGDVWWEGMQPPDYIGSGSQNVQNTYNITVNGALDPEAVARQIDGIMRTSANRSGNYTNFGIGNLSLAGV